MPLAPAFPIRPALLAGPRVIAGHPTAFAIWVLISLVQEMTYSGVMLQSGSPISAMLSSLPFTATLAAAALRAMLQPEQSRAAYLRLGPEELWVLALVVLAVVAATAVALPVSLLVAVLATAFKSPLLAGQSVAFGTIVAGLAVIRFSPAPAHAVVHGRIDLGAAWKATRGLFWRLALIFFVVTLLERLTQSLPGWVAPIPASAPWLAPWRLAAADWRALFGTLGLVVLCGVAATLWQDRKTLG